jgi:hypothetical protein
VAGRRIADPFAALAHVGSWHIADKLDARFHGRFGKKLTSVFVAEDLFTPPDRRFAASLHPLPKCGTAFCCVCARNAHEHWLFACFDRESSRVNVAARLRSLRAMFSTPYFIATTARRSPII